MLADLHHEVDVSTAEATAAEMKRIMEEENAIITNVPSGSSDDTTCSCSESVSTPIGASSSMDSSDAAKFSNLQVSFAEKTVAEMKQIVDWYENCNQDDNDVQVRLPTTPNSPFIKKAMKMSAGQTDTSFSSPAAQVSKLQVSVAEATAAEMRQILEGYSTDNQMTNAGDDAAVNNLAESMLLDERSRPKKKARFSRKTIFRFLLPAVVAIIVALILRSSTKHFATEDDAPSN